MNVTRYQRAIRNLGGYAGGTSRLARPPAVLEEPDIRPGGGTYTVHVIDGYNLTTATPTQIQLEQVTESGGPPGMTSTIGEQFIYLPPGTVIMAFQFDGVLLDPDSGITSELRILDGDAVADLLIHTTIHGAVSTFSALTDSGNPPSTLGAMPFTVPFDGAYAIVFVESTDGNALTDGSVLTLVWE